MSEPILEMNDLASMRGNTVVLHGITLRIEPGEHTAILGPNGAGKSSLIRLLMLEDRPLARTQGVPPLRLFGRSNWDLIELRQRLAIVTNDFDRDFGRGTSRGRVLGEDVALSGLLGSEGVFAHHDVTTEMRAAAREALARVDAQHLARKPLNEMSTGERRRTLIARALITRPSALLLDEPTTGLDFVARHRFLESIRRLAQVGTTMILVTHHAEEIVPETRRVVLLREGRIAFDGPTEQALTAERLEPVFGAPVRVERTNGYVHVRLR